MPAEPVPAGQAARDSRPILDRFEHGADPMIVTAWERRWREHAARGQPVALRYWIL
jgi:hypothetical protein